MKRVMITLLMFALLVCASACSGADAVASETWESSAVSEASEAYESGSALESSEGSVSNVESPSSVSELSEEPVASAAPELSVTAGPSIEVDGFFDDAMAQSIRIINPPNGSVDLAYEPARELMGKIDFSQLIYTDKDYGMEMYSSTPDPCITFVAPDFSHELKLDKTSNIAMYQVLDVSPAEDDSPENGKTYYYTMPAGFYEAVFALVQPLLQ